MTMSFPRKVAVAVILTALVGCDSTPAPTPAPAPAPVPVTTPTQNPSARVPAAPTAPTTTQGQLAPYHAPGALRPYFLLASRGFPPREAKLFHPRSPTLEVLRPQATRYRFSPSSIISIPRPGAWGTARRPSSARRGALSWSRISSTWATASYRKRPSIMSGPSLISCTARPEIGRAHV